MGVAASLDRRSARLARLLGATAMACVLSPAFVPESVFAQTIEDIAPDLPPGTEMLLEADTLIYDNNDETVTATGGVRIDYGGNKLVANQVTYDRRSRRLVAVFGNNDHGELRERLPEIARASIEGLELAVVHETGPSKGRDDRMSTVYVDVDVLVFGHSHIPWDTTTASGLRLLNPGSPTDRRRQPHCTYMTAVVEDGALASRGLGPILDELCAAVGDDFDVEHTTFQVEPRSHREHEDLGHDHP